LPPILTFALQRVDYNEYTFEREKINSRYEFPLEIDLTGFMHPEYIIGENCYELFTIVVHRGTANSGHYFAYIRDILNEGNWDLKNLESYKTEPTKIEIKKEEEKKEEEKKQEIIIEEEKKERGH